jgi:hypothetical protein
MPSTRSKWLWVTTERPEACAAPEQLALRALTTIDHDAMAAGFH